MTQGCCNLIKIHIWRGREDGQLVTYEVPARANQTVLDIVTEIQRHHEPTLAYRFSCRVGVCGSCAMMVNGKPRWTCRSHVSRVIENGEITIEPLRNMPRIKDLACDMTEFFQKWQRAGGRFKGNTNRAEKPTAINPQSLKRKVADAAIECINCAVCYSGCDIVAWKQDYLGPAALNRAWTLVNDERHCETKDVMKKVWTSGGCGSCHTQGNCMRYCPVGVKPTESIAGLKRMALVSFLSEA